MKINLLGNIYDIEYVSKDSFINTAGCILFHERKIKIADNLSKHERVTALLHEINHYIIRHACAENIIKNDYANEEYIVDFFATHWTSIMALNPNLDEILNLKELYINKE